MQSGVTVEPSSSESNEHLLHCIDESWQRIFVAGNDSREDPLCPIEIAKRAVARFVRQLPVRQLGVLSSTQAENHARIEQDAMRCSLYIALESTGNNRRQIGNQSLNLIVAAFTHGEVPVVYHSHFRALAIRRERRVTMSKIKK